MDSRRASSSSFIRRISLAINSIRCLLMIKLEMKFPVLKQAAPATVNSIAERFLMSAVAETSSCLKVDFPEPGSPIKSLTMGLLFSISALRYPIDRPTFGDNTRISSGVGWPFRMDMSISTAAVAAVGSNRGSMRSRGSAGRSAPTYWGSSSGLLRLPKGPSTSIFSIGIARQSGHLPGRSAGLKEPLLWWQAVALK